MELLLGVTKDNQKKKPALYKFYDFTKGGTDIVDQKMGSYTVKLKCRRWVMVAFSYLLDIIRVNSSTVLALNKKVDPKKVVSFDNGYLLAKQLVMPQILRRNRNGLNVSVLKKIELLIGVEEEPRVEEQLSAGMCKVCLDNIKGRDNYKKNKGNIGRIKTKYSKCKDFVCEKHSKPVCEKRS